ncbi:PQQ-binding-like beta-propeller repeat protein [Streptomyces sp. NPDC001820]|uniref:protein kinase domain-containing protein n=1 Tax=Streptomyces sp. NPDC001820 TaxID=3364613 RepID=UPI00367F1F65
MLSPLTHNDPVQIGAYRLTACLGSGGMGTVYLARSAGGRTVALKTMHAGIAADADFRTRFRLETDAARIIGGHHGATVVDADPLAETPWLATEYVLGPPLDDAVSLSGALPEPSVRALGAALAGALAQLHASEVVHRDLKPSNVMITAYGPKIIDFGIARAAGDDRLTRTGAAAGTPAFMSPEQATGQEHTPAGDVFALAGVLVFALTGHGPFGSGQPADLLYRVRYGDPDLTGVPAAVVPILMRCLSKDPARRPATMELAAELHHGQGQFADHLPATILTEIARRATEVWQHQPHRLQPPADHNTAETIHAFTRAPMPRRKVLALSGGSALAMTAAGVGAWSWLKSPGDKAAAGAEPSPPPTADAPLPTTVADRRETWRKSIRSSRRPLVRMTVGEVVAMMTGEGLLALDARSGERRWIAGKVKHPRHVHSDGKRIHVLLPGGKHGNQLSLHAVDPVGGRTSLASSFAKFDKPLQEAALLQVTGDTAYLAARKGLPNDAAGIRAQSWSVMAVDPRTGTERWSSPIRSYDMENPEDSIFSALAGNRLILCRTAKSGSSLEVSARDARNGQHAWDATVARAAATDPPSAVPNTLATDDTRAYVGGNRIQAHQLTDGAVTWTFGDGRNSGSYGTPVVKDGVVYAAEKGRGVVALSATNGELRWEAETGALPDLRVPPVVGGEFLFVMAETGIRAVSLSKHSEDWSSKPGSPSLVLHEDSKRLVQSDGKQVFAIRFDLTY